MDARDDAEHKRAGEEEVLRRNEDLLRRVDELGALLEATLVELKENERKLRKSEEHFRTTFERAAVGMAHVAPDGRWLRINEKLCEIVGYEKEELLGLTFRDITHPEDIGADLGHVQRMLEGEIQTYSIEKRYVRKDGLRVWVCLTVSLVRSASSGEPEYFISVVEDITERKLAELVPDPLADREMEVLRLITEGQTNRQIAEKLRCSEATVKLHVQRILARLGVSKRAEAARRAIEIGLLPPPPARPASKAPTNPRADEEITKRPIFLSRFGLLLELFVG